MRWGALTTFAGALLSACGSDAGSAATSPDGGTGSVTASAECSAYAAGYCTYLSTCAPADFRLVAPDVATCTARVESDCAVNEARPGATKRSAACSTALKAATCTGPFLRPDPSCDQRGLLADGAPCYLGEQCQSGHCPGSLGDSICGKCGPRTAANGECRNDEQCEFGTSCQDRVCKAFAALDQPCDAGGCVLPLRCIGSTCKQPLAEGAACGLTGGEDGCDIRQGLRCEDTPSTSGKTCQKTVFAPAGTRCGASLLDRCDGLSICPTIAPEPHVCETIANEGESCRDIFNVCVVGTACKSGVCRRPEANHCR